MCNVMLGTVLGPTVLANVVGPQILPNITVRTECGTLCKMFLSLFPRRITTRFVLPIRKSVGRCIRCKTMFVVGIYTSILVAF